MRPSSLSNPNCLLPTDSHDLLTKRNNCIDYPRENELMTQCDWLKKQTLREAASQNSAIFLLGKGSRLPFFSVDCSAVQKQFFWTHIEPGVTVALKAIAWGKFEVKVVKIANAGKRVSKIMGVSKPINCHDWIKYTLVWNEWTTN